MLTIKQYQQHKGNCKRKKDVHGNPVEMRLTFLQWIEIWESSGHAESRGRRKGQYVMARCDDTGHYEVGNVFIQLATENIAEAGRRKKGLPGRPLSDTTKAKISGKRIGQPSPNKGNTMSSESKAVLSVKLMGNQNARKALI